MSDSSQFVSCPAANLKCSWTGPLNELDIHVQSCTLAILQPLFAPILQQYQDNQTEEYLRLKIEYEKLQQERDILKQNQQASEQIVQLFQNQAQKNQQLEHEIERLQRFVIRLSTLCTRPTNTRESPASSSQANNQNEDSTSIKRTLHEHDTQIKLLARRKIAVPVTKPYLDKKMEQLIDSLMTDTVTELNLNNRNIDDYRLTIICKKGLAEKSCTKLYLDQNQLTGVGANTLSYSLYNNMCLTELDLSRNPLGDLGVYSLAQVLSICNSTLTVLHLSANQITDEGADYLVEMLKVNKTLSTLNLSENQLTDQSVRLFSNVICQFNRTLRWLSLAKNQSITDQSLTDIQNMLKEPLGLETIFLNDCGLSMSVRTQLQQINGKCEVNI